MSWSNLSLAKAAKQWFTRVAIHVNVSNVEHYIVVNAAYLIALVVIKKLIRKKLMTRF
jgi:hypothetical protein